MMNIHQKTPAFLSSLKYQQQLKHLKHHKLFVLCFVHLLTIFLKIAYINYLINYDI